MSEVNPYAAPATIGSQPLGWAAEVGGPALYRKGRILVLHKRAVLPDRCLKSNQPAEGRRLRRNLSWHHPAVYLSLLISVLIYIILALVLRKTARIEIGLSEAWFRKRRRAMCLAWFLVLGGIAAIVGACLHLDRSPEMGWGIPAGMVVLLGASIYGLLAARMVVPVRISDDYVWLKGVHPDFLAPLPPWPYEP